ncbi:MAG: L-lactate dehydrogenase [Candidatus Omnitrophica bacterium]|jgi:L-lactate dehydrogenase|nr:L-lactate dehydrogenase [Candidatus Omnitrophota bacterium]
MLKPRISIIGSGNVGMRYAYSLMLANLARSIVILDIDKKRTEGEAMDLASCMPFVSPVDIAVGDYPDLRGSDIIVITAGVKQKPGQSRFELAKQNVEIYKDIIPKVIAYAKDAIFLIVTNPVDVLSYAAYKISQKPWQEVMGSGTVLDSARLKLLLSRHCNIDARNVHAYVLGEHGDSEFPVWSRAMIGGILFKDYCPMCNKCNVKTFLPDMFSEVRNFAYKVIERKGETSYGIGLALNRITSAIIKDENSILPVSSLVDNYYDVDDVYMSIPAVVNKKGVRELLRPKLEPEEIDNLKKSAKLIKEVIRSSGL